MRLPDAALDDFFFSKICFIKTIVEAMNIRERQIRGVLFNFLVAKKCPFLYIADTALSF